MSGTENEQLATRRGDEEVGTNQVTSKRAICDEQLDNKDYHAMVEDDPKIGNTESKDAKLHLDNTNEITLSTMDFTENTSIQDDADDRKPINLTGKQDLGDGLLGSVNLEKVVQDDQNMSEQSSERDNSLVQEVEILQNATEQRDGQSEEQDYEEGRDAYRPGGFHPVYIDDIYHGQYQILRKIGYGQYSTVWLVKDLTRREGDEHEFKALKVLSAVCYDPEQPVFEREILTRLREADKSHAGYPYICHLLDDFEHSGPNGNHVCLVFELMAETLQTFRIIFKDHLTPNSVMRKFTIELLFALDYAHDSQVIHTDIKPDNIFVKIRDQSFITKYLIEEPAPKQEKSATRYSVVRRQPLRYYYLKPGDSPLDLDIALGDWGVSSWTDNHLTELIQPVFLRAPEVLIQAPWNWTTDWWNLGAVILEVFRGVLMFSGKETRGTPYQLQTHLKEIVHFFGPFPKSLLENGNPEIVQEFFNEDGTIKGSETLYRPELSDDYYMSDLSQERRENFISFLRAMMKIDPKERLPTNDLLDQPLLEL